MARRRRKRRRGRARLGREPLLVAGGMGWGCKVICSVWGVGGVWRTKKVDAISTFLMALIIQS